MTTGAGTLFVYGGGQTSIGPVDNPSNAPAPSVNRPLIFEPTAELLTAQGRAVGADLAMAVSAGPAGAFSSIWGGANVYVSTDNVTYVYMGRLAGQSRMGTLTAELVSFQPGTTRSAGGGSLPRSGDTSDVVNADTTHTLSLSTVESNAELDTVTYADAAAFRSLCIICDTDYSNVEFLSYQTATLTGANTYDLTTLFRGLYGTAASPHETGSLFARLDNSMFGLPLPPPYVGVKLYIKLQSFNVFNAGVQELSDATPYTFMPSGIGAHGFVQEVDTTGGISGGPITDIGAVFLSPVTPGDLLANISTDTVSPGGVTATAFLDNNFGSVQYSIIQRSASVWIGSTAYVRELDTTGGISGGPITVGIGTVSLAKIAAGDLLAVASGTVSATPSAVTATAFLDYNFGTVQNTLIRRGASTWNAESLSAFLDESFSTVQGMMLRRGASSWAAESPPLPYAQFMPGVPAASAIARLSITEASAFAANFSGSAGLARTASSTTAITAINVVHAGTTTQIGSVTFSTSTTATFGTTGGTVQSMAAGDLLEFAYPASADATLADVAITLRATRS